MGANIPLADQHLLSFFSNVQAARDNLEQRLNSVAAKQFLVAHYTYVGVGGAPGYRDRFMQALRDNGQRNSAGYPVNLRRIALANGKLNGLLPTSADGTPCGEMLDLKVRTRFLASVATTIIGFFGFSYKTTSTQIATSNANFLPSANNACYIFYGVSNQISGLSWGRIGPVMTKLVGLRGGPQGSWDLAPGGLRDTQRQLHDQFEAAGQGESFKVDVTNVRPNHCFIPTVSALGYQYQSLSSYQGTSTLPNPFDNLLGRDLVCTGEIPFDAYYGPTNSNTFHVMPDNAGLSFLGRELSRTLATPEFTVAPLAMCPNSSGVQFSVKAECAANRPGQPQPTTTYFWTPGPGLQLVSGQGTATVQVQPVAGFTGTSTVQVVAMRTGYATSAPIVTQVSVTNSYVQLSGPTGPECYYASLTYNFNSVLTQLNVVWHVYLDNVLRDDFIQQDLTNSLVVQPTATGNLLVTASDNDVCAPNQVLTAYANTTIVNQIRNFDGSYSFCPQFRTQPATTPVAYPNPTDKELTIVVSDSPEAEQANTAILFDAYGQEVRRVVDTLHMPTADLPAGLYHLIVEQRGKVRKCQIKIAH